MTWKRASVLQNDRVCIDFNLTLHFHSAFAGVLTADSSLLEGEAILKVSGMSVSWCSQFGPL